jgi:hypothetical protein
MALVDVSTFNYLLHLCDHRFKCRKWCAQDSKIEFFAFSSDPGLTSGSFWHWKKKNPALKFKINFLVFNFLRKFKSMITPNVFAILFKSSSFHTARLRPSKK